MSNSLHLFSALRQAADPDVIDAIQLLVEEGRDRDLNRINPLAFAARQGLDQELTIAAFLHCARVGVFDMAWNVLCPGCGGVLGTGAVLKSINKNEYHCSLCGAGYEPTLDEMVEVTFTVAERVRRIGAHDPERLPPLEYYRQIFWSSGVDLPDDFEERFSHCIIEMIELAPGERAFLSVNLPAEMVIIFDAVTHSTQFIEVKGEPTTERRNLSMVISDSHAVNEGIVIRPGPVRLTLENHTHGRVLPNVCVANDALHDILAHRQPFLTAKRLLTNQTFRDIYRAETLDVDQRFKITSMTFLFTDLRGSTMLYERVGDLAAFDLVRAHFRILQEIVAAEAGAVVKTIGDAVMATFPTPDRAIAAALRMRDGMRKLNSERGQDDILLKIGIHEGPCLAVTLNDRQDYFGQSVNIASRVQNLADAQAILTTGSVIDDPKASAVLAGQGVKPVSKPAVLRGIEHDVRIFALP